MYYSHFILQVWNDIAQSSSCYPPPPPPPADLESSHFINMANGHIRLTILIVN